ncbi:CAAX protease [Helicobacter sp. MIT 05-5294]|uniref:CAAX protease n=1 Tax=Helicobacter sp. MIT 05-5294 TaxID=1548150 RepID=UPI000ACFFE66|nr:CAAX protease [Helicobacter sp. MIT 05-5294]TLD86161.1 CAAX protease [Helicobacter sp. MIT 05-5294]
MSNFSLESQNLHKIKELFTHYSHLLTPDFENRIKQSIRVLHHRYLWGACKETQKILAKYPTDNLFDTIMNIYNKRRKEHQAKFLLLHCFENALRSTLAVEIANLYNNDKDDWFLKSQSQNAKENRLLKQIADITHKRHLQISDFQNTFDVFDIFSLGDLKQILANHWSELSSLFTESKEYKSQPLPSYGTRAHLIDKIDQIRNARNEIFHNKPTKIRFQKDLEILLLRLGYNLYDATNIGEIQSCIALQYHYDN